MSNVDQLESQQSLPDKDLINDLRNVDGDIMILGIGGKMGPTLGMLAVNAFKEIGTDQKVYGTSRFSNESLRKKLESFGIHTLAGDLMDEAFLDSLPACKNVIYMAGNKFGTSGNEHFTWAMNSYLPGRVAEQFKHSNIVAFSSGNVYPFMPNNSKGAKETTKPDPIGEYAQSCLGRERLFEHFAIKNQTPTLIYRLNYAVDLRYGVLYDIAKAIYEDVPIDITTSYVNVIWQGDANSYALRSLLHCTSPATFLNITGPEKISVKWVAEELGQRMKKPVNFIGQPEEKSLLNDASRAFQFFGKPKVGLTQLLDWTADWIMSGGEGLGKPTHFQERKGNF
ncbi:MAG: NAD-dependent epimerase/dehydratase family protein [Bacteroidota bacterium]